MHVKNAFSSSMHSVYLALRLRSRVFTFSCSVPLVLPISYCTAGSACFAAESCVRDTAASDSTVAGRVPSSC